MRRRSPMCGYCHERGHTKRGCPTLKKEVAEGNQWAQHQAPEPRKCSYCRQPGHTRRKCDELHNDKIDAILKNRTWAKLVIEDLKKCGVGVGTVLKIQESGKEFVHALVTGFFIPAKLCYKKPSFGFLKVRFFFGDVPNPSYKWNFYRSDAYEREQIIRLGDSYRVEDTEATWDKIKLKGSLADSHMYKVAVRMDNQPIEKLLSKDFISGKNGIEDFFDGRTKRELSWL